MTDELVIQELHVNIDGKEILKGINLTVKKGEVCALMGPNGSGKSTLAYTLMGHPNYTIESGKIFFKGHDITGMPPNERAKLGLFLSFQYPAEITGVTVSNFLRTALNEIRGKPLPIPEFHKLLKEKMLMLKINDVFARRYLNEGFSGGEKKRTEILQMAVLQPEMAILDETDSGLDVDALRAVSEGINQLTGPGMGILIITHYQRILSYIKPDSVHVMIDGKIVKSGKEHLAREIEERGYDWIVKEIIAE